MASLTISQNTGPGYTWWQRAASGAPLPGMGGAATTLAVATASVGSYTYTLRAGRTAAPAPAASATVTVVPTTLSVSQRDPDNGQLNTNTIKPYLQLNNAGTQRHTVRRHHGSVLAYGGNFAPLLFQI